VGAKREQGGRLARAVRGGLGGLLLGAALLGGSLLGGCVAHEKDGDRAVALGDWRAAYGSYRAALADDPENAQLQGKFAEARGKALAESARRAQACQGTGDWECALAEADFSLSVDPGDASVASFRAQAATQVAVRRLDAAVERAQGGDVRGALDAYHRARALSPSSEVAARAEVARGDIVGAGVAQLQGLQRERRYPQALELAAALTPLDGRMQQWTASLTQERDAFYRAEYDRLLGEGNQALRRERWEEAAGAFEAARALLDSGPAVPRAAYARHMAEADRRVQARDWRGAAEQLRGALATGEDARGLAAQRLELVEVRPYRVAVRSVLVAPVRNDGSAWAGASNALLYQAARMLTAAAERSGDLRLLETAAGSIPEENRPTLRLEVTLPDGTRLTTPARRGVFVPLDAELVAAANGLDERAVTFRVLAQGAGGEESLGSLDVPLRELTERRELRLKGGAVLGLQVSTLHAPSRTPGTAVGMAPVGAPQGGTPPAPGNVVPANGVVPVNGLVPASGAVPASGGVPAEAAAPAVQQPAPAVQPAPAEGEGEGRPGRGRKRGKGPRVQTEAPQGTEAQ
jgi:tetratricopeptide (TPR) repeat protein